MFGALRTKSTLTMLIGIGVLCVSRTARPDIIDDIPPGHWFQVPNSAMANVDPCPNDSCVYSGAEGQDAVMNDWAGGAFDTRRNQLLVTGGGHLGYAGNELYAFSIATLSWSRLSEPSTEVGYADTAYATMSLYDDGIPGSRHTYNYLEYYPDADEFLVFGGSRYPGESAMPVGTKPTGEGVRQVHVFDLESRLWTTARGNFVRARMPDQVGSWISAQVARHPTTGNFYYCGQLNGSLAEYNPSMTQSASNGLSPNTWRVHGGCGPNLYRTMKVDPVGNRLVMVGGQSSPDIWMYDLSQNPATRTAIAPTGNNFIGSDSKAPGFEYHAPSGKFVAWSGGADVYVLDPIARNGHGAWHWEQVRPPSSNTVIPTAPNINGTYGRFRYVPSKDVFILVNETTENVFIYRPTASAGSPPPPSPPTTLTAR